MYSGSSLLFLFLMLCGHATSVDRTKFKTCEQSSFCRRMRAMAEGSGKHWELDTDTIHVDQSGECSMTADLMNSDTGVRLKMTLKGLHDGNAIRVRIVEAVPLRARFYPSPMFYNLTESKIKVDRSGSHVDIADINGKWKVSLGIAPFIINVFTAAGGSTPVVTINSRGLLAFEETRKKPPSDTEEGSEVLKSEQEAGLWEENFASHHDSKPFGPTAISADIDFPQAVVAYGLPEHASSLNLKNTKGGEPYRLYNLDVFEYELDSPMSLYAAIPIVYGHSAAGVTAAILWANPSETWIDVTAPTSVTAAGGVLPLLGVGQSGGVETRFMSESGDIDIIVFAGPTMAETARQYTDVTGHAFLPPMFSLGYHQSRWNYMSQDDVDAVHHGFDEHDIPMDVMWLDIEHTDGKKYFTWDPFKFSDPIGMQRNLSAMGRKLVVIVDPHIKRESGYFLHDEATAQGYYVKNSDNTDYEGWCWPGSSSYLDLVSDTVRDYYSSLYSFSKYSTSTVDLHLWNDMNEPSVFNGPEVTMPKDKVHDNGKWEHREVHNMYGIYQVMGTYKGILERDSRVTNPADRSRPFILTRSAFSGSQRYTAIWTGDNAADWKHMAASLPMCLSLALGGMSFCGADVGGFFGNPDSEMLVRWYQTGAWLPFFRAHAHIDTRRREPWLFGPEVTSAIRNAVRLRYSYLPTWYTLFHRLNQTGDPVLRPLSMEFPKDPNTYHLDDQIMIGGGLLFKPVTSPGETSVTVYLPSGHWFDGETLAFAGKGPTTVTVPAPLQIGPPVFQREGFIIARRMRVRRSSMLMSNDPFTLFITPDSVGEATGELYVDDGESHRFLASADGYIRTTFKFRKNSLTSSVKGNYPSPAVIEKIIISGIKKSQFSSAVLVAADGSKSESLRLRFDETVQTVTIRKPNVSVNKEFVIKLQ